MCIATNNPLQQIKAKIESTYLAEENMFSIVQIAVHILSFISSDVQGAIKLLGNIIQAW